MKLHNFYLNKKVINEVSETLRTIFKRNIKEKSRKMKLKNYSFGTNGRPCFCEEKSPLCFDILEKNRLKKRGVSFFIFREAKGPEILLDYMEVHEKKAKDNGEEGKIDKNSKNFEDIIIGRHHHICNGKYVKTKMKTPSSFQREIEMKDLNPQEQSKSNEHFIIKKTPHIRHFLENNENNHSFGDKIKEKFLKVFNILCLRERESRELKNKKKMESKFVPVFDYSSEFNTSILNSRKTYEEGEHLWKENKKKETLDLKDYGPEDFFKEIDIQIENIEKIEILRKSRSVSFNSNFRSNYVASLTNLE
jgi:hypothetical protein